MRVRRGTGETNILHLLFDFFFYTNIFWILDLEDRRAKNNHFGRFSAKEGSNRADQARPSTHMQVANIIISFQMPFKWHIHFFLFRLTFVVPDACVKSPLWHDLLISASVASNKREPQFPPIICLASQFFLIFNNN